VGRVIGHTRLGRKIPDGFDIYAIDYEMTVRWAPTSGNSLLDDVVPRKKRAAAPFDTAASPSPSVLAVELSRNVVERVVERFANALHRTDGGNGNQSSDQTILDGGRALLILQKLYELGHFWSPIKLIQRGKPAGPTFPAPGDLHADD
jgi:hypothetical protein